MRLRHAGANTACTKSGTRMDVDKFKNDLMIGETSSIEFKRFEMACLAVKHPVKVRYDT